MRPRRWDCDKGGFMFLSDEGKWVYWEEHAAALMAAEANRNLVKQLKDQVEWYKKAERLLVWNGTEWQVRHDAAKEGR